LLWDAVPRLLLALLSPCSSSSFHPFHTSCCRSSLIPFLLCCCCNEVLILESAMQWRGWLGAKGIGDLGKW
jgi:hypothetical protein